MPGRAGSRKPHRIDREKGPRMNNEIGVMAPLTPDGPCLESVRDFGLRVCQVVSWEPVLWTDRRAGEIRAESESSGVRITAFWSGLPGPAVWDLVHGPFTIGLAPAWCRAARVAALKKAAGFARRLGARAIITHLGFLPENPLDRTFAEVAAAVREVADFAGALGVEFWFETGQETPVTMLRLIDQAGRTGLGVNMDPANLILYGKANPADALDVFGAHVRNIHAKDGFYPTDPMELGREARVGEGRVRYPEFVKRLKEIGFTGEFIIEREITGEQQRRDIADAADYLRALLAGT
jgi:L-ribulose-5-phosphate 3-epimerase